MSMPIGPNGETQLIPVPIEARRLPVSLMFAPPGSTFPELPKSVNSLPEMPN